MAVGVATGISGITVGEGSGVAVCTGVGDKVGVAVGVDVTVGVGVAVGAMETSGDAAERALVSAEPFLLAYTRHLSSLPTYEGSIRKLLETPT